MSEIVEMLKRDVYLMSPSMGWFRGRYALPKSEVTVKVSQTTVDPDRLSGNSFRVMTNTWPVRAAGGSWYKYFAALEAEKSRMFEPYIAWHVRGTYVVPTTERRRLVREFYGELERTDDGSLEPVYDDSLLAEGQSLAFKFRQAVKEFAQEYPKIVRDLSGQIDGNLGKMILPRLPKPENVADKFHLRLGVLGISDFRDSNGATADEYDEICRQATKQQVEDSIRSLISEPRRQLAEALAGIVSKMETGARITSKSFGEVFAALDGLQRYSFMAGDEFNARMAEFRRELDPDGDRHVPTGEVIGERFRRVASQMITDMEDDAQIEETFSQFGGGLRHFSM